MDPSARLPVILLTEEQVACLVSPVRRELLSAFSTFGPAPVDEIATQLGVRAKSLYYHVGLLEQAGLLRQVGTQTAGKRPETIYDAVSDRVVFREDADPKYQEEIRRSVQSIIRSIGREFDEAMQADMNPTVYRISSRLSPEHQEELRKRVRDLIDWVKDNDNPEASRLRLAYFEVPIVPGKPEL